MKKINHSKVTMSHIAAKAGVSQSTVSLVLNNSSSIKLAESTRKKVLRTAKEMGYEHRFAEPYSSREKIILVINGLINYDPFIEAINSAQECAWLHNKLLAVFIHENSEDNVNALNDEINNGGYIAAIYASSMTRELKMSSLNWSIPTVFLNCYSADLPNIPCVLPADKIGGYMVTHHLIKQGFKQIAILTGELWMDATNDRIAGYRQALIDHDIFPNDDYIKVTNWSLKEAYQKTLKLLALSPRPQAIFCSSDYIALGCYQAILSQGLRIPDDIAVAGYDDQSLAAELTPSLTTYKLPYSEMGEIAVQTLLDMVNLQSFPSSKIKVEGQLVLRKSSIQRKSKTV